jgi:hypothetical protein
VTLSEFLAARLDEDEAVAKGGAKGPGSAWDVNSQGQDRERDGVLWDKDRANIIAWFDSEMAACVHAARHDPRRVLREVEAGRQLLSAYGDAVDWLSAAGDDDSDIFSDDERPAKVQWYGGVVEALTAALAIRAAVWSDHPDYDLAWRPEP